MGVNIWKIGVLRQLLPSLPTKNGRILLLVMALGLTAAQPFQAGWVGVGGAVREDTRSIVFGRQDTSHIYAFSGHKHFGVFRCESYDNGLSWGAWVQTSLNEMNLFSGTAGEPAQVNTLLISGNYASTPWLLAATSDGQVFRSVDHGATWTPASDLPGGPVTELVWDNSLYRVLATIYGNGIYQSVDQGQTFTAVTTTTPPGGNLYFADLDLDPNSPGNFYAVTNANGTNSGGLYHWNSSGSSWENLSTGLPQWGSKTYSLSSVAVSPSEQHIWIGDMAGSGILASSDGGSTWVQGCITCEMITYIILAPDYSESNLHIYFSTDWGWYESLMTTCVPHQPTGLWISSISPDINWSTSHIIWLATSDGIRKFGNDAFPEPPGNDNMSIFDISFLAPSPNSTTDNVIYAASHTLGVFRSIDGGLHFHRYMPSLSVGTNGMVMSNEVTALALHPNFNSGGNCGGNESTVYMASKGGGVYQSSAQGSTWLPMNLNLPPSAQVTALVHAPIVPFDGNYPLFAGVDPGGVQTVPAVFRLNTLVQPGQWEPTASLVKGNKVNTVVLPPNHDGSTGKQEVFVGTDQGLLKSTTRGSSWAIKGLPGFGGVTGIVFHPLYDGTSQKTIFASRFGSGVYKSVDGGESWIGVNSGLTSCAGTPSYQWDFTNDLIWDSTSQTTTHSYEQGQQFTWRAQVTYNGQSPEMTGMIKSFSSTLPFCYLTSCSVIASPTVTQAPAYVQFSASAVTNGGCIVPTPVTYRWDFNNDGTWDSYASEASWVYRSVGTHTYKLDVVVNGVEIYSYMGKIIVQGSVTCPWTMIATATPPAGMGPLLVNFSASAVPYVPVTSLAISPDFGNSDQAIVAGLRFMTQAGLGGIYLSTDGGANWTPKVGGLTDLQVNALSYARAPVIGNKRLLCGTQKDRAFFSDEPNSASSPWIPAQGYQSTVGEIRAVAISPVPTNTGCSPWSGAQGSDIFVGGTQGVFWSNDGGQTFRPINQWGIGTTSACVPEVTALFVFVNPKGPTATGSCMGMPSGSPAPMLLAGTNGRGIWYRYANQDPLSNAWDWTNGEWKLSSLTTGTVNRFTRENNFGASPLLIRAATSAGVFNSHVLLSTYGECWESAGLLGNVTDIENGKITGLSALVEKVPDPDAPSGGTAWGTVMGTGVQEGIQSETFEWYTRNGSGAGMLPDLDVQSVLELTGGTVLVGTTSTGLYRTEDGGTSIWEASNGGNCGIESTSMDVRDILESGNGDVLCAVYGTGSDGGVFLSADFGRHWVSISDGFGSGEQTLSSIIANDDNPPTYYAGTYTNGSYAATIEPLSAPTVTNVDITSGSSSGGTEVNITGTNFLCSCPTGYSCGTCTQTTASFGGVDGTVTNCSSNSITVKTPARPGGTVELVVRNPDTRSVAAGTFTFNEAEGSSFEITVGRDGSNQVVVSWVNAPNSSARVYRSTTADFSTLMAEETSSSVPNGSYTYEDGTGTNPYTYFYKVE